MKKHDWPTWGSYNEDLALNKGIWAVNLLKELMTNKKQVR